MFAIAARSRRRSARAGFTLVELVISAGVLLVVSLAGYSAQVRSNSLLDSSRTRAIAIADLESCMEDLLTSSTVLIPAAFPDGASIPNYEDLHLTNERITPTYPGLTGSNVPDPLQIVLTATWTTSTGHNHSLRLATATAR